MPEIQRNIIDELNTTTESWRTFRIIGEMVNAFDTLNDIEQHCISIFGSARVKPDAKEYAETVAIAKGLAEAGFGIISGFLLEVIERFFLVLILLFPVLAAFDAIQFLLDIGGFFRFCFVSVTLLFQSIHNGYVFGYDGLDHIFIEFIAFQKRPG